MRDVPVSDETLQELFHNMSPYRVPRYQRTYAWTSEEIDDFVNDLAELAKKSSASVRYVSMDTEEGATLMTAFGGVAALLRWPWT